MLVRWFFAGVIASACAFGVACGGEVTASLGEACARNSDCGYDAQCFLDICSPLCDTHTSCGGGYLCDDDGLCSAVASEIGDACARELDCGPGQGCRVDTIDTDGDGWLTASCQAEQAGSVTGGSCIADADCRAGICSVGRCTELCLQYSDCPFDLACVEQPRIPSTGGDPALFRGCLPPVGRLELTYQLTAPVQTIRIPVPAHAQSFAIVAQVPDPVERVGAVRATAPDGTVLYEVPEGPGGYYDNLIRYEPSHGSSTLLIPNTPVVKLATGIYEVTLAAASPNATARVIYRVGPPGAVLDLHFYFLDLRDHPCLGRLGPSATLNAEVAASSREFQVGYLGRLSAILLDAGIAVGEVTFHDVAKHYELAVVTRDDLGTLLALSDHPNGLSIFVVRSFDPPGIQAMAGGTPGSPIPGTTHSGVAIAADTLCYRGWAALARQTAHVTAKQLGLFPNLSPDGAEDPIPDSPATAENLLYFSEFGGSTVTPEQAGVMKRNPVLQ